MRLIDADALIEFCAERWIPLNIDAVNMQPTIQPEERTEKRTETHGVCLDAISRKPAIDALMDAVKSVGVLDADDIKTVFDALPTIQPVAKEGHWIKHESPDGGEQYECSRCGVLWEFNDGTPEDNEAYYCPKCGKKLITK